MTCVLTGVPPGNWAHGLAGGKWPNGAIDYMLSRPDVDPNQIGGLGFSPGWQITIRAAAENNAIKAVSAEDPSPAVLVDHPMPQGFSLHKLFIYPGLWLG